MPPPSLTRSEITSMTRMLDTSDDRSDPIICLLVQQAIVLEKKYKEIHLQGDEVDLRVKLWRDAIDICKSKSKLGHVDSAMCQLCMILQIPDIFSSDGLAHLHSPAHIAVLQHHLAEALGHCYNHTYSFADIDESICLCRDALVFFNKHANHISPAPTMACMGTALCIRFTVLAQQNDLREGFELLSSAVHMCPSEPHYLADLGNLLLYLYLASGSHVHLDESLVFLHRAHSLRIGHPARGKICGYMATASLLKDQHVGIQIDHCLEALIEHYKEMLIWQPLGHHSHFEGWDGLGMVLGMQYRMTGNIHHLNCAIHYSQTAYIMLNPRHPRTFRYSVNLSNALRERYEALGYSADVELALFHAKRALDHGPPDRRPNLLRNLATIMTSAAEYSGDVEILSESIYLARDALNTVSEPMKFMAWQTLGNSLIVKASHFGDLEDLQEGIHCIRQMLECVQETAMFYTYGIMTASRALLQQYEMNPSQHFHALTEAIDLLERIRDRKIPGHYRAEVLHWTAKAYRAQFYHSGLPDHLKLAFTIDQQALNLCSLGHPLRNMSLAAISDDLVGLSVIAESVDLENAINMLKEALKSLSEGHPDLSKVTVSLAKLLLIPNTPYTNYGQALSSLLHMFRDLPGSAYRCIMDVIPVLRSVETGLASKWIVDDYNHRQCLDVYEALINILPRLASLDLDSARQIQILSQARDLATKASSHAITLKQFGRAVELLESGRAVFWAQHLRVRTSFDSLEHDTAKELRHITHRLEVTASPSIPSDLDISLARSRMERIMTERRHLSARFDELVDQVQSQPGMSNFLRNLDYKALSLATTRGPIVIFQTYWLCVIPSPHESPQIAYLPEATDKWIRSSLRALRESARRTRMRLSIKVSYQGESENCGAEYDILAEIWMRIGKPLLEVLGWHTRSGQERPRLFLCPTGMLSFLPIHAAGMYGVNQEACCLSDYCIASYTPTINALLSSQRHSTSVQRNETRFLLAAAPEPFMFSTLPAAREEANTISSIVPPHLLMSPGSATAYASALHSVSTADDVLQLLPDATVLHLACHGQQSTQEPLKSGFVMQDKMLEVRDLLQLNLPNARLAFLSACETAQGDIERPDEALHLAATMLYAGFKSVIGTMWSMGDVDGPVVAETVYRELFAGDGDTLDLDLIPYALDSAVRKLRAQGLEPSRWAPYIHIGL